MAVTSSSLSSGASIAAGSSLVIPPTITRADLSPIRSNSRPIENTQGIKGYRFPSDIGKYYMQIEINDYSRSLGAVFGGGLGAVAGTLKITDTVILPLPQSLVDENSTAFNEDSLGDPVGGAVDAVGKGLGYLGDFFLNKIPFVKRLFTNAETGKQTGVSVGGAISGGVNTIRKVAEAGAGIATNKYMTIVLQGPQYKTHSFSWKLYPKTSEESKKLNEIVNLLKISMRTNLTLANFYFEFPKVFKLRFTGNEEFLYEFKPAVLQSMTVNYTPSGSPNFYGKTGAPDGIILTMNFKEIEYWLNSGTEGNVDEIKNYVDEIKKFYTSQPADDGSNNGGANP